MSRLRVLAFSISLDGFSAGPDQSLENPLGVMGTGIMDWVFRALDLRHDRQRPSGISCSIARGRSKRS